MTFPRQFDTTLSSVVELTGWIAQTHGYRYQ
jgi:hypothetical protein